MKTIHPNHIFYEAPIFVQYDSTDIHLFEKNEYHRALMEDQYQLDYFERDSETALLAIEILVDS